MAATVPGRYIIADPWVPHANPFDLLNQGRIRIVADRALTEPMPSFLRAPATNCGLRRGLPKGTAVPSASLNGYLPYTRVT
jgi:hypothetical protein